METAEQILSDSQQAEMEFCFGALDLPAYIKYLHNRLDLSNEVKNDWLVRKVRQNEPDRETVMQRAIATAMDAWWTRVLAELTEPKTRAEATVNG